LQHPSNDDQVNPNDSEEDDDEEAKKLDNLATALAGIDRLG
jgi:hypothetical protein